VSFVDATDIEDGDTSSKDAVLRNGDSAVNVVIPEDKDTSSKNAVLDPSGRQVHRMNNYPLADTRSDVR